MTLTDQTFNPMCYDAMLELATRIGGRYNAWADEAGRSASATHWRNAGIELRRQVRDVDAHSQSAIEAKRAELRELWATMPAHAPAFAA
ncbi:MAG: hypothetical protein QM677_00040 [Microbacterium sp.]